MSFKQGLTERVPCLPTTSRFVLQPQSQIRIATGLKAGAASKDAPRFALVVCVASSLPISVSP